MFPVTLADMWIVLLLLSGCGDSPVILGEISTPTSPLPDPSVPGCGDGICVLPLDPEGRVRYHDVAIDEDGAAWISWVEAVGLDAESVWIARSASPGAPLDPPIQVPTIEPPIVGTSEKPSLAVGGGRVAFAYTGRGLLRHGDAHSVYVQLGTIDDDVPSFEPARLVEHSSEGRWVMEQARVAIADGEVWLLYKRQIYGVRDIATSARERDDFTPVEVSEALSQRHDCSPPDLQAGLDGMVFASLRSNLSGWLETVVLSTELSGDGSYGPPIQVSDDRWRYSDAVCPDDGPRLAQLADGTLATLWVAPSGDTWRGFLSTSSDGGASWSLPALDHEEIGLGERWPTITALEGGRLLTTVELLEGGTRRFTRDSLADPPRADWLQAPDGGDLSGVEIATRGTRTVALGQGDAGQLWLIDL